MLPQAPKSNHPADPTHAAGLRIAAASLNFQQDRREWVRGGPQPGDRVDADCASAYRHMWSAVVLMEHFLSDNYDLSNKSNAAMLLDIAKMMRFFITTQVGHADHIVAVLEETVAAIDSRDKLQALNRATAADLQRRLAEVRAEITEMEAQLFNALDDPIATDKLNIELAAKLAEVDYYQKELKNLYADLRAQRQQPSVKPEQPAAQQPAPTPVVVAAKPMSPADYTQPTQMHPHALAHAALTLQRQQSQPLQLLTTAELGDKRSPASTLGNFTADAKQEKKPKLDAKQEKKPKAPPSNKFKPLSFTPVADKMADYPSNNWIEVAESAMLCAALYIAGVAFGVPTSANAHARYSINRYYNRSSIPEGIVKISNTAKQMRIRSANPSKHPCVMCPDYRNPSEYKLLFLLGDMWPEDVYEWNGHGGKLLTEKACMPFIAPFMAHVRSSFDDANIMSVVHFHIKGTQGALKQMAFREYMKHRSSGSAMPVLRDAQDPTTSDAEQADSAEQADNIVADDEDEVPNDEGPNDRVPIGEGYLDSAQLDADLPNDKKRFPSRVMLLEDDVDGASG